MTAGIGEAMSRQGAEFQGVSASIDLPPNAVLVDQWNDVTTTTLTSVTLSITVDRFEVRFFPGILVDVQWPLSNVRWTGLTWTFGESSSKRGRVTAIHVLNSQRFALDATDRVRREIRAWFQRIVQGTALMRSGYSPLTDHNLDRTLRQLVNNFRSGPSTSNLQLSDLTGLSGALNVATTRPFRQLDESGAGLEIPQGAGITVRAIVNGTAQDVVDGRIQLIRLEISSNAIFIVRGQDRLLRLARVSVNRGCAVRVERYETLSQPIRTGEGVESLVRFLAILVDTHHQTGGHEGATRVITEARVQRGAANPELVRGLTTQKVESALQAAVRDLYQQHQARIASYFEQLYGKPLNIDAIFGSSCRQ